MADTRYEYKLATGARVSGDRKATPASEWLAEGKRFFGDNVRQWRFKCPMCGKVYSVQEFIDARGKGGPNGAYQECIGRYKGAGSPGAQDGNPNGCNWVAYGLFGTCGKGRLVQADDGSVIEVFHYAEMEGSKCSIT